ncbi:hypothetical protein L7F22_046291 [Adiantum nelumboides]|nr:hypothetical protein [Adiantum nelumboides]
MAYAMPSHGFSAMLTSTFPSPPMLFEPPPNRSMPNVATVGEHTFKSPTTDKLLFEESTQVAYAKTLSKNARSQNQSAKDSSNDRDGTAPKRGRTSKAKAKLKEEDEDNADK